MGEIANPTKKTRELPRHEIYITVSKEPPFKNQKNNGWQYLVVPGSQNPQDEKGFRPRKPQEAKGLSAHLMPSQHLKALAILCPKCSADVEAPALEDVKDQG